MLVFKIHKFLSDELQIAFVSLHKYLLLHMSYHSQDRKQNDKVKVKITKSKTSILMLMRVGQLTYVFWPNCFNSSKSQICTMFTVVRMVIHVKQDVFMQEDISNAIYCFIKHLWTFICISQTKLFRTYVYINFFIWTWNKPNNRSVEF